MKPLIAREKSSNQISECWASGTFFSFASVTASSQLFNQASGFLGAFVNGLLASLYKDLASSFCLVAETPTCSLSFAYQPLSVSFGSHAVLIKCSLAVLSTQFLSLSIASLSAVYILKSCWYRVQSSWKACLAAVVISAAVLGVLA